MEPHPDYKTMEEKLDVVSMRIDHDRVIDYWAVRVFSYLGSYSSIRLFHVPSDFTANGAESTYK